MFMHDVIIFHMVDRCTRWYHSVIVPNRLEPTLLDALDSWVRIHGPMKELVMDQETGIQASAKVREYFQRKQIHYEPRAKGQQVPYIDRRGALIRGVIHKIISQLWRENKEVYIISCARGTTTLSPTDQNE